MKDDSIRCVLIVPTVLFGFSWSAGAFARCDPPRAADRGVLPVGGMSGGEEEAGGAEEVLAAVALEECEAPCSLDTECDDGNDCTTESCVGECCRYDGECTLNANCVDDNPCSADTCVDYCCIHAPSCHGDADCDDGRACTVDVCTADGCCENQPQCVAAVDCDDGNACTVARCVAGCCTFEALSLPPAAFALTPGNGDLEVGIGAGRALSWRRVSSEATYEVFLTASEGEIDDALVADVSETSLDVSALDLQPATTYYWRVDTRHPCGVVRGRIWSFTTIADDPAGAPVTTDVLDASQDTRGCGAFGSGCGPTTPALIVMLLTLGLMRLHGSRGRR